MCRRRAPEDRCWWHSADLSDFDEEVVRRLLADEPVGSRPRRADTVEAVRRMAGSGWSDGQIAFRFGFHRRSVIRIRQKHGIASGVPFGAYAGLPGLPNRPVSAR